MDTGETQRQIIEQAHQRCAAMQLHPDAAPALAPLPAAGLARILERNQGWRRQAAPVMEDLYGQIADGRHLVVLADAGGVVLQVLGAAERLGAPGRPAFKPGTAWSEACAGANAIGTALARQAPVQVHGDEHYLRACRALSGAAAPVFDAGGGMLGALAIVEVTDAMAAQAQAGRRQGGHPHTLALVRTMAQSIEHRLRAQAGVAPGPAAPAARNAGRLDALDTGDRQLALAIATVRKVLGRGIPIMIQGETGTGKELLAQAIHLDGPRAGGPLVVVNCAAIPEALIESELFGYEDGAFTGARKKGAAGRIAQANGGTLFLDEIGDMPLSLQARLLRVLQERSVTPLGGGRAVPVDIDLVCATHRSLRGMIADGSFRADLYYRLNGLVVKLPPLRERSDLKTVVARMLAGLPGGRRCTVSGDVMRLFERHGWPGNLRQLHSVLRTAVALAATDGAGAPELALCHLPCDLVEETAQRGAPPPSWAPSAGAPACASPGGAGPWPLPQAGAPPGSPGSPPPARPGPLPGSPLPWRSGSQPGSQPLPQASQAAWPPDGGATLELEALAAIRRSLALCGGNVSAAAKALGISRNTIYRKMAATPALP